MLRRDFLKRMAFAALATWFLEVPLPKKPPAEVQTFVLQYRVNGGGWEVVGPKYGGDDEPGLVVYGLAADAKPGDTIQMRLS